LTKPRTLRDKLGMGAGGKRSFYALVLPKNGACKARHLSAAAFPFPGDLSGDGDS
ncbi:unnamed protein product, partial [Effrenium voratum]